MAERFQPKRVNEQALTGEDKGELRREHLPAKPMLKKLELRPQVPTLAQNPLGGLNERRVS